MVGMGIVTDEDPEVVRRESLPGLLTFLRMRQGRKPEPVSIEEALAYDFSPLEQEFIEARNRRQAVGTPDEALARVESLLRSTGADELMLTPQAATLEGRMRSLEIMAAFRP
ncbi:MAG: luciferase-like monooxygenase, partial [Cryobacterium sp.]|nr:luciferase-like monooxygenase [Cryobacterium sp.]